jgi:hypothetical protein
MRKGPTSGWLPAISMSARSKDDADDLRQRVVSADVRQVLNLSPTQRNSSAV